MKESNQNEEFKEMMNRLNKEVEILQDVVREEVEHSNENYTEMVAREQLESIGELIEAMSQYVGDGEKIDVVTPSKLNEGDT